MFFEIGKGLGLLAALPLAVACASTPAAAPAPAEEAQQVEEDAPRRIEMEVTNEGFVPADIHVQAGEPVTLAITRTTERTCATEIMIPAHDVHAELPLDETVEVTFTPEASGQLQYGCGMGQMIGGIIFVE